MNKSEEIKELVIGLIGFQAEMKPVIKDSNNPFFKSGYASLLAIWEQAKPILNKNGLAVVQAPEDSGGKFVIKTTILHKSGQWLSSEYPIVSVKNDPQSMGSAVSYAKRYALQACLGIVTDDDDDAETAMGRANAPLESPKPPVGHPGASNNVLKSHVIDNNAAAIPCEACSTALAVSKNGKKYYCPNFKNPSPIPGLDHAIFPIDKLEEYKQYIASRNGPMFSEADVK